MGARISPRMPTEKFDHAVEWLRKNELVGSGRASVPTCESEESLAAFEQRHDVKLEKSYRAILKKYGSIGRLLGQFGELVVCDLAEIERQRRVLDEWLDESEKTLSEFSEKNALRAMIPRLRELIPIMYVDGFPSNHTYLQDRRGRIFIVDTRHFDGDLERPETKSFEALLLEELIEGARKEGYDGFDDRPREEAAAAEAPGPVEAWDPARLKVGSVVSGDRFPKWGGESKAESAAAEEDPNAWKAGVRVLHKKFGGGVVSAVEGEKLVIRFDSGEEKRLLTTFVERK